MQSHRLICSVVLSAGALLAGCQSYEPRPLDLDAHRSAWRDRSPSAEDVAAFARRLEEPAAEIGPFDPTDGVSLAEAEIIALVYNADLRLARARGRVATARAEHAGLWDDPELQIDVLRITESVSDRWIVSPGLAFTIPLSGRLEAEKARADAAARAALDRIAEAEWRVRHEVRRGWLAWSAARLRADETRRLAASMDSLVASTARLADAGEMPRTEAALFAIEQTRLRQGLRRFRGDAAEGEQRLRALMGLAPGAPLSLVPAVGPGETNDEGLDRMAERNLTLARMRDEYEVAEQTLRREIRKQFPDLTIGPQYESDQGQSRIGFLGAIPVPIFNANKAGIAEAEAERELARAAFETEYERLAGALAIARARAEALAGQRDDLASVLAPLIDRQLDDARRLLEIGEGGGLVLLESLSRAHETKLALVDLRLEQALASAEIAHLIGPASGGPVAPPEENPALDAEREVEP